MKNTRSYPIFSADSHLEIDSKWWIDRVPERWRDRAPRVIRRPDGRDAWLVEGWPLSSSTGSLTASRQAYIQAGPAALRYDETPGTGPASQRVKEQDEDGVCAEVLFWAVSSPRMYRSIVDDEPYKAVVHAYNTWLGQDYCAENPDRLIGVGVLPRTGVDDCIAEMEYCLENGVRVVGLSRFPNGKEYPTPEDDKFWAAAVDMKAPITVHVQFDTPSTGARKFQYPPAPRHPNFKGRGIVEECTNDKFCLVGGLNVIQMIFAGVFDRFPDFKVFMVETQIGWLPHFFEQADARYDRHVGWSEHLMDFGRLKNGHPSDYMREHVYWGFQENQTGVQMRNIMSADRLIWGSDFPHQESDWPNSMEVIEKNFAGVPEDQTYKMVCGNAVGFYHLEDLLPKWEANHEAALTTG